MTESSRTRTLLAAMVAVLALAVAGGCGSDENEGSASEARALLADTVGKKVESGDLELQVKADVQGIKSLEDPLELKLEGPFKSSGRKRLPTLDWDITFDGAKQKLTGGLIATHDNAFVELQGQAYEVGRDVFARLSSEVGKTQPDRSLTPRSLGVDPASWLKDPKVEDGEPIGGDEIRKVTGSVDVRKVVKDFVGLVKSPSVRRQLERQGGSTRALPEPTDQDLKEVEDAIEDIDVELGVDKNDVLRRFATEIAFDVPGEGDSDNVKGKLELTYVLRKVGTDPVIRAPSNPRPLSELLGGFGLGGLGGGLGAPRR